MGERQQFDTDAQPGSVQIQERGEIFFFYRPKVEKQEAHSPDDVQRFYIILRPHSGTGESSGTTETETEAGHGAHAQEVKTEKEPLFRFIIMGRKRLPHPARKSQPYWGFVDMVTTDVQRLKAALQPQDYDTSTRGHRHVSAARAVGEGVYRILRHKKGNNYHTHLIYKLEFPREEEEEEEKNNNNEAQKSFNIEREGSFIIQIKNPDQGGSSKTKPKPKRRARFPARLQGQFGSRGYHAADPPEFLNFEGCELLLISASDDIEEELGVEVECETRHCDLVETFGDTAVSMQPLLKATWL